MNIQTIPLYEKPLFMLNEIDELIQLPAPMPENEAAFVYILEGKCSYFSEIENLELTKGQAVLAKSGDGFFKTHLLDNNPTFKVISIRFHRDVIEKIYQNDPSPFYKNAHLPLTSNSVMVDTDDLMEQFGNSLLTYFNHTKPIADELLILKLKEFIALLLQSEKATKVKEIMCNLFEEKTFEFKEIIKAHLFSPLSIEDFAQLTHRSLSSFKKEFKRIYNTTPNKYIIDQRIQKAAQLLEHTDDSISEITYHCEFKTLAHMSRVFKDKYGCSPSHYRLKLVE